MKQCVKLYNALSLKNLNQFEINFFTIKIIKDFFRLRRKNAVYIVQFLVYIIYFGMYYQYLRSLTTTQAIMTPAYFLVTVRMVLPNKLT